MNQKPKTGLYNFFNPHSEVFIIAEIGGNHEGNFEYASTLVESAIQSGAHAIKLQIYRGDKIVSNIEGAVRNAHFKKFELTHEQHLTLAHHITSAGKIFMASLWDEESLALYDHLIPIHKIGSGDLTNYPLLKKLVETKKPLILSTAMSTLEEIASCVEYLLSIDPELIKDHRLGILHCVAMYGDPKDDYAQLLSIKVLKDHFKDVIIGYSDHTKGMYASELSIPLGARIIEKHFTNDQSRTFRDHHISAVEEELRTFSETTKKIIKLLGNEEKKPVSMIETPERIQEFRRAVYPAQDIQVGTIITEAHITTLRPAVGIDARDFDKVIGKKIIRAKKQFEKLTWEDLE